MKFILLLMSLFCISNITFSQTSDDILMSRPSDKSVIPSYIKMRGDAQLPLSSAFDWMNKTYTFSTDVTFEFVNTLTDKLGMKHDRYQQYFKGVKIKDAVWIVHSKNDFVLAMNGLIYSNVDSESFLLTSANALESALHFVNAQTYKWEIPGEEDFIKKLKNDPNATNYPSAELFYFKDVANNKGKFRPSYKFTIYAHAPLYKSNVYIDAVSGDIILEENLIHDADVVGSANTAYSGVKPITADSYVGGFRLRESGRGDGINTYNMQEGTNYNNAVDFVDNDNNWNNANAQLDQYATDAHYGAEMTYDYYLLKHNRNSIDDNGFQINSFVHYDVAFANAFWDGDKMTYGDGNGTISPLTALDVVGHEISHGLTSYSANLVYAGESGALNESFSDIFGTSVENYARPNDWDWLIGGDLGGALRSMSDPNQNGNPDTYLGDFWDVNEEVHTNSGVQNFWFYLLTEGGSGTNDNNDAYSVNGLGITAASEIAFRNLTVYLTPDSDYNDARFYAIISASDLYGGCTPEVESTTNAWYAVGVGDVYVPTTVADFAANSISSCEVPFTVDFQNMSSNGITYIWDFGDGQTSTGTSPSHTYTSYGDYTVSLSVDGGTCGTDSQVYVDYVSADSNLPCDYQLTTSGSGSSGSCTGNLTDSGGDSGNYGDNETAYFTISPTGAQTVTLSFNQFDIEAESNCGYDYLEIYDGNSQAAPLIGRYCNGSQPPVNIITTGGSAFVKFSSDIYLNEAGFSMSWSCAFAQVAPESGFHSDDTLNCDGVVSFIDQSTNNPTSWLWDFGDGQTSTAQHPIHTYATVGFYTVELQATNAFGADTQIKSNYIHVDDCALLNELDQVYFNVYPNPVSNKLYFTVTNASVASIQITDVTGRIVFDDKVNDSTTELNLESIINAGTYFVTALDQEGKFVGKSKIVKAN